MRACPSESKPSSCGKVCVCVHAFTGAHGLISGGILKTTMLTSFPLMVMVELYMFYMVTMVHFSMFKVEP